MTSDAKIGLLLGLVFIFVIAFIINGLPNFGDRSKAEAAQMMTTEKLDVAGDARLDWDDLIDQEGEDLVALPETAGEPESPAASTDSTPVADAGGVRRIYTLDGWVGGVSGKIQDVVRSLIETVPTQETATEPAPLIESSTPETAPAEPSRTAPVEVAAVQSTPAKPTGTPPQKPAAGAPAKTYVVQAGDVLATVAKKAYGPEEGNRLVNINRIFEANRSTLKTPDEIFAGQTLVIPPLPAAKPEVGKADDGKLSAALFEKVEQIGKKNVAEVKQTSSKPEGPLYVVQDGDSLWKIAAGQLGNGARWEEIIKLNADTLKSKDAVLVIGMKLRMPAK
ncbi:MAG: LysM peptidoglycan-binding domain-containing protein [Phycisphaerae bacterium]|nr:LysM peptidoglycan-binding domain-containing protein [Phycisphaerae bacterium]